MEIWLKALGVIATPLIALLGALAVKRPRVCRRIAQFLGSLALTGASAMLIAAIGALMARAAVMAKAADALAITDGETAGDGFIRDQLAAAVDPVLAAFVGVGGICATAAAICVAA